MTESQFTARLLKALRSHRALGGCVIWKFNDRVSAGIPDFAVVNGRMTLWCEVKVAPNKASKLQLYYLEKIGDGGVLISATSPSGEYGSVISATSSRHGLDLAELVEEIVRRVVNQ